MILDGGFFFAKKLFVGLNSDRLITAMKSSTGKKNIILSSNNLKPVLSRPKG
jgi:hypothetical protein